MEQAEIERSRGHASAQGPTAPGSNSQNGLGMNEGLVESMRERYLRDPRSISPEWGAFFASQGVSLTQPPAIPLDRLMAAWAEAAGVIDHSLDGAAAKQATNSPAGVTHRPVVSNGAGPAVGPVAANDRSSVPERVEPSPNAKDAATFPLHQINETQLARHSASLRLIHAFRVRGHRIANVDPLADGPHHFPEVDPEYWGFTEEDLDKTFLAGDLPGGHVQTLRQILETVRRIYCGTVGIEYAHIQDASKRDWIRKRIEANFNRPELTDDERRWILSRLSDAEQFEKFLHIRFIGQKRFSLEGAESLIPLLDTIVEDAPKNGIEELVLGMAHRGRLNVLCNIVGKSKASIFSEFEDLPNPEIPFGSGDVKYHKGYSKHRITRSGETVHLSLTSNPSHLEAVNPVVEGRTRAKQMKHDDPDGKTIVPVVMHGDAAFAGQGMVAETLNLSQLRGYCTGGTIHVVIDNQIGFTTTPAEARSTLYATDVAKMIQVPIFQVNGDDPEAVVHVVRLAMSYRRTFRNDVVINMVCYRRHGHNEGDEPTFTQPVLYAKIKRHPSVKKVYTERLIAAGVVSLPEVDEMEKRAADELDHALASIKTKRPDSDQTSEPDGPWTGFSRTAPTEEVETGVARERLLDLVKRSSRVPDGFHVHRKLVALLEKRQSAAEEGRGLDWAFGEMMAYATLVQDGYHVRLSGQDTSRGTFSHRHAMLVDQETGEEFAPLANMFEKQGRFEVYDSLLSEAAVLGFEYGYSLAEPNSLTIWEAQFGDFANGAQVIIDQFIASAEKKWNRLSGLVMFLPHGYEGQGPEHSSARIERYLQLCAEDNLQVVNCSTPAQIFHLLRRQMLPKYRCPLIVFTPKSLLRLPAASSRIEDFTSRHFARVLDDPAVAHPERVHRVLLCSGKVYYDLLGARTNEEGAATEVATAARAVPESVAPSEDGRAVIRLEQIYPFPEKQLAEILSRYGSASEFVWAQEEPRNMGAWSFVRERIEALLPQGVELEYAGREPAASPAVGASWLHLRQQRALLASALGAGASLPQ